MNEFAKALSPPFFAVLVFLSSSLLASGLMASSTDIDQAIKKYYAGHPEQAIAMLKPLAMAGDIQAQTLMGNIAYAMSKADPQNTTENPLDWYLMAAEQGSPEASYALGAIYHNKWLQTRQEEDANKAEHFYQQAVDRGYTKAQGPLMKMAARNHANRNSSSINYSNSSFSNKPEPLSRPQDNNAQNLARKGSIGDLLKTFESSANTLTDATKLEALLQQLNDEKSPLNSAQANGNWPDESTLIKLLTSFGVDADLAAELAKLPGHVKSASELEQSPGSN